MSVLKSVRNRWLLGGVAGALLSVVIGWFLVISPQHGTVADLRTQAADAQTQTAVTRSKVRVLENDQKNLPALNKQLASLSSAIPAGPDTAQFVAQMQAVSSASQVSITALNLALPSNSDAVASGPSATSGVMELAITITATGDVPHLTAFLYQLQNLEPRALTVGQVTQTIPAPAKPGTGQKTLPSLSVSAKAFFTS